MNPINEHVNLPPLMNKLRFYIKNKNIKLEPSFLHSLKKLDSSILKSFLNLQTINIITERACSFSHLSPVRILDIHPKESIYTLLYIFETYYTEKKDKVHKKLLPYINLSEEEIHISIYGQVAHQSFIDKEFLSVVTQTLLLAGNDLKIDVKKIDTWFPISKNKVAGTQKYPAGTFFEKQSTKYFKPKHNPNSGSYLPIEELRTKQKDYLKGAFDEIIVVWCPVCGNKHKRNYFNIKDLFTLSSNTVTLSCNHTNTTHLYDSKPCSFKINSKLCKKYKKLEIIMFIINNKEYYELSKNKKTS